MMEFWFSSRPLSDLTNFNGPIPGNTLYLGHYYCLLICNAYLPGRHLWVTHPKHARQRRFFFLHLYLPSHRARPLLRLLSLQRNLKYWGCPPSPDYDDRLCWVRSSVGPNVLLRGHRHYQPSFSRALRGRGARPMNLGRLFGRQCHTNSLLRFPFSLPLCYPRCHCLAPSLPPRNRFQQPYRP